ncbi:MAG: threonylcarbamoyl-AMP synthase [Geminicoccaceae bacterium]|nr:threonylcarbamoyl-AMP synthase [Geminicoccaceae bacterium]
MTGARSEIERAAELLLKGGLVAFPTETVYGLGALACNDKAIGRVYVAKGRPGHNPLIAHVASRADAAVFADLDQRATALAERFWPGPLTLVLPLKVPAAVSPVMTAGLATVAVRVPAHPMARALLEAVELPVAAPSANRSGGISPTTAGHVVDELGDALDMVLDGGPCPVGIESTVVDLSAPDVAHILRPGGLDRTVIEACVGPIAATAANAPLRGPGMLARHYAPSHPLRLNATRVRPGEALLAFGPRPLEGAAHMLNLSPSGDLDEAARNLYAMLRDLDQRPVRAIAVMPIPARGLGEAIADRLGRGAVPAGSASAA